MFNSEMYLKDLDNSLKRMDLESIKNKSFFITGSCGLICSYLIDMLIYANTHYNTNCKIYALSLNEEELKNRFSYYYDNDLFNPVIQNVCDKISISNIDYFIHGASNASPELYIQKPVDTMNGNYLGMLNILEAAKYNQATVLYLSSSDVYGSSEEEYLKENDYGYIDLLNVRSSYASSKRATETLCISYYNQYNIDVKIVRLAHIYGPTFTKNDNRAVSSFIRNVLNGEDIIMKSDGKSVRSYCYVADAVIGLFTVLFTGKSGEAYNISNNDNIISIKELATNIASIAHKKLIIEIPNDNLNKKIDSNVKIIKMNNSKLKELGWESIIDIDNGINNSVNSLKEIKGE